MMTTNLFVIANVKQLRTGGSFRVLLRFFPNILGCWRPKFSNFVTVFTVRLSLARFWRAFGISRGGVVWTLQTSHTLGTPLILTANCIARELLIEEAVNTGLLSLMSSRESLYLLTCSVTWLKSAYSYVSPLQMARTNFPKLRVWIPTLQICPVLHLVKSDVRLGRTKARDKKRI